jgi:hypothetical protein
VTVAKLTSTTRASKTLSPSASPGAEAAKPSAAGTDPLWDHNARTWITDMAVLLLLALGFALITWWRLLKMGPIKRR